MARLRAAYAVPAALVVVLIALQAAFSSYAATRTLPPKVEQRRFGRRHHWRLVLEDAGRPVVDSVWGESLLDTRTRAKRQALAGIVCRWTQRCARDGFDAVELDNLDLCRRSHHLLTRTDNQRYAALLVRRAHSAGLAAARKNWAEWGGTIAVVRRDVDLTRHGVRRWC